MHGTFCSILLLPEKKLLLCKIFISTLCTTTYSLYFLKIKCDAAPLSPPPPPPPPFPFIIRHILKQEMQRNQPETLHPSFLPPPLQGTLHQPSQLHYTVAWMTTASVLSPLLLDSFLSISRLPNHHCHSYLVVIVLRAALQQSLHPVLTPFQGIRKSIPLKK